MSHRGIQIVGSVHRRMFEGLLGSGLALFSRIFLQAAQVPLFLYYWGPVNYGEWLVLFSIPAYLALGDFGMGEAGANFIARAVASGDVTQARRIYSAVCVFVTGANMLLLIVAFVALGVLQMQSHLGFQRITGQELSFALGALSVSVVLTLQAGTAYALLRAIGRYGDQQVISGIVGIVEFFAIAVAISIRPQADAAAIAIASVRLLLLIFLHFHVRHHARAITQLHLKGIGANIRMLMGPSLAFMGFPVANALLIQGYNILIGVALGPTVLVVYAACATAARALQAAMVAVYSILTPEAAILLAKRKLRFLRNLHRAALAAIMPLLPILGLALFFFTVAIFPIWVQNKVEIDHAALATLIFINVVKISYYPSFAILSAASSHKLFSMLWLCGALLSLLVSTFLSSLSEEIAVLLIPVAATEIALFLFSTKRALWLLHDSPGALIANGPYHALRFARLSWIRLRPSRGAPI